MCRTDDILIGLVLNGDERAFSELMERYGPRLLALIRREVPDRHGGEDVFQETLIQVWRDLGKLRDRSRVLPWLVAVARNRCREFYKSAGNRREYPAEDGQLENYINRMGRVMKCSQEREAVTEAVNGLSPTQRQTAELRYIHGETIRQIARRLDKPEGTIKSQLYHARRALGRVLRTNKEKES